MTNFAAALKLEGVGDDRGGRGGTIFEQPPPPPMDAALLPREILSVRCHLRAS